MVALDLRTWLSMGPGWVFEKPNTRPDLVMCEEVPIATHYQTLRYCVKRVAMGWTSWVIHFGSLQENGKLILGHLFGCWLERFLAHFIRTNLLFYYYFFNENERNIITMTLQDQLEEEMSNPLLTRKKVRHFP